MNRQLLLGACLLYLLSSTVLAQGPGWHRKLREIVPTVSSAEDVETRFKHAVLERKFVDKGVEARFYEMPEGRLSVYLAHGRCSLESNTKEIPSGTILEIAFFPSTELPLRKFGLVNKTYEETMEDDNPTTHLISVALGIDYAVQAGRVIGVTVFPAGSSRGSVKCSFTSLSR